MNYLRPERLDPLARDYALGTLSAGARRRFERLLRDHAAAREAVAAWQGRLTHLADAVPASQPSDAVWQGLEQRLFPQAGPRPVPAAAGRPAGGAEPGAGRRPGRTGASPDPWWRAWWPRRVPGPQAFGGVLAGLLVCLVVVRQQPDWVGLETPRDDLPASYVGLLAEAPGGPPTLLASSRRHGRQLTVKLLQPVAVPDGRVAQLWALPREGPPFPVGVVPSGVTPGRSVTLPLADTSEKLFFTVPRLAVSFEASPARPGDAPSAPFVLQGPCVKLW